ncbi:hypothetical protein B0H66DRAFT_92967 [Apodospora peruviana]|uniref:Uncharacterized protein n=1 Tax=Apodospora peruviana TaxID=516989 RepID=A0AAE0ITY6_9PEZI|nr:hypothetical protein B0H66DRAFT_92967 [Apodospora peruviana]
MKITSVLFQVVLLAAVALTSVDANCFGGKNVRPKDHINFLKQALVAAQRVEKYGWIDKNTDGNNFNEVWTGGKPGNDKCISLGVRNNNKDWRVKLDTEDVLNRFLHEFTQCPHGGTSKYDDIDYIFHMDCPQHDTTKMPGK